MAGGSNGYTWCMSSDLRAQPTVTVTDEQFRRLRVMNLALAVLHLATGAAMIVLSNGFEIAISSFGIGGPPGTDPATGTVSTVFHLPLGPAVAAFALLSALFHFLVAAPAAGAYRRELERGQNRFRWVEYSLSATLMIVLIALITGISDMAALIAIAAANIAMILFGWVMEVVNKPGEPVWWAPFWFGCIAGIAPWIAIVATIVYNVNRTGGEGPPGFVYGIIVSIFVLFNCFAVNQWLQYRGVGKWTDYLVGERTYGVLSLVAKTLLAWQIFANVLIDQTG